MRRRRVISLVLLLGAGAVAVAIVAALELTGSSRETLLHPASHFLRTLPVPKLIHFRSRARLPDLSARALNHFERTGLNDRTPKTHVSGERVVRSSDFPETRVLGTGGGAGMRVARQALVDKGHAVFIAEPDIATNGRRVMITWNDGVGFSQDGGRHFRFVDPATAKGFPPAADGFCCDQVAVYAPGENLWLWLLQYWPDRTGANILRLAVGRGDTAFDTNTFQALDLSPRRYAWDTSPGAPAASFDYPDAALTRQNLFLTANVYLDDDYSGTLVLRIPLADLAADAPTLQNARWFTTKNFTAVLTAGATNTMYILSHSSNSALQLWSWADGVANPVQYKPIQHTGYRYFGLVGYNCRRKGGPPASDWCERLQDFGPTNDDRPTTAWIANGVIGVAWNAQQAPAAGFPYPYVMVVQIDEKTKTVIDEPIIWNRRYAFQYLDAAPNARGDVGGLVLTGGGSTYEGCAALGRARSALGKHRWNARLADRSNRDPSEAKAGDFLGVSPVTTTASTWVGACNTLHGGRGPQNEGIRFVAFGR